MKRILLVSDSYRWQMVYMNIGMKSLDDYHKSG